MANPISMINFLFGPPSSDRITFDPPAYLNVSDDVAIPVDAYLPAGPDGRFLLRIMPPPSVPYAAVLAAASKNESDTPLPAGASMGLPRSIKPGTKNDSARPEKMEMAGRRTRIRPPDSFTDADFAGFEPTFRRSKARDIMPDIAIADSASDSAPARVSGPHDAAGLINIEAGAGVGPLLTPELAILLAQLESPDADAHTHAYMALYGIVLAHLIAAAHKNDYFKPDKVLTHISTTLLEFSATLTPKNQEVMRILVQETYGVHLEELDRLKEKKGKAYKQAIELSKSLTNIETKPTGFSRVDQLIVDAATAITWINIFSDRRERSGWVTLELHRALGTQYLQNIRLCAAEALVAINFNISGLIAAMSNKLSADTGENAEILTIFLNHPDERVKQKASELLSAISRGNRPETGVPLLYTTKDGSTLEGLLVRLARAASAKKDDQIADPPDGGGTEEDAVGYYDETISQDEEEDRQPLHFTAGWDGSNVSRTIYNPVFNATNVTYRVPIAARLGL